MQVSFHTDGEFTYQEITNVHTILHRGKHINLYHYGKTEHRFFCQGILAFVKRLECANVIQLDSTITQIVVKQ